MAKHKKDDQPQTAPPATVAPATPQPGSGDKGASFDAQHSASAQRSLDTEKGMTDGQITPNGFSRVSDEE